MQHLVYTSFLLSVSHFPLLSVLARLNAFDSLASRDIRMTSVRHRAILEHAQWVACLFSLQRLLILLWLFLYSRFITVKSLPGLFETSVSFDTSKDKAIFAPELSSNEL